MFAAVPARAVSLVMVPRTTWGATGVLSYMQMYIYVPDNDGDQSAHLHFPCHLPAGRPPRGRSAMTPLAKAARPTSTASSSLLLDNPGQNCWDVGTTASLTHDGGGDTQGLAEMIKYTITKYAADPTRVYIMGGSGGGMMTQAMLAVYPEPVAGSARAGSWPDAGRLARLPATSGATAARTAT